MAALVLAAGGAWAGSALMGGATMMGLTGAQWGWMAGSMLATSINQPDVTVEGARLSDLRVQSSAQGQGVNKVYGTMRCAGNMIWSLPIKETRTETETSGGGGKGGGPTVTNVSYTYSQSFAIGICEGPIAGIRRIWINGELVYNISDTATTETLAASATFASNFALYLGTEDQTADATIQADKGVDATPAYRGLAYIVFNDLQLADFGNRTPNIEFEVVQSGSVYDPNNLPLWELLNDNININVDYANQGGNLIVLGAAGQQKLYLIDHYYSMDSGPRLYELDLTTGAVLGYISLPVFAGNGSAPWFNYTYDTITIGPTMTKLSDTTFWYTMTDHAQSNTRQAVGSQNGSATLSASYGTPFMYGHMAYYKNLLCFYGGLSTSGASYSRSGYSSGFESTWTTTAQPSGTASGYFIDVDGALYAHSDGYYGTYIAKTTDGMNWSTGPGLLPGNKSFGDATFVCIWADGGGAWYLHGLGPPQKSVDKGVTWTSPGYNTAGPYPVAQAGAQSIVKHENGYVYALGTSGTYTRRYPLKLYRSRLAQTAGTLVPTDVTVADIAADLCELAGAPSYDVTALTDTVSGYLRVGRGTPRASLESLQQVYYFDAVEDAGTLVFVKRGGSSVAAIPEADTAAHSFGTDMPVNLASTFLQETELPHEVAVGYLEVESDYLQGVQYARRLTGNALNTTNIATTVALSATKARQVAEVLMWFAWMGRATFTVTLSRKYAWVKPTDVITVSKGSATHTLRVVSKQDNGGIITLTLVREDSSVYTQTPPATSMTVTSGDVLPWTPSTGHLLDIPLLRDEDDGAGFYFAATPNAYPYKWSGAQLYRSVDSGASWAAYGGSASTVGVMGSANGVLGDFHSGNIFDELNAVSVTLVNGELSSMTELQVLSGGNHALLGDEIIQFKTATLTGTRTYTLTGLLRGCHGTEWSMRTHTAGERFVLLSTGTSRVAEATSQIGLAREYKIVSFNTLVTDAATLDFTDYAVGIKPLSPVHICAGRDASGNIALSWTRRTRTGGEWRDLVDASLGESSEVYDLEVMNGNTVVRAKTGLTVSSTTYSATEQTADFGAVQDQITLRVFQVSPGVGRGFSTVANVVFPTDTTPGSVSEWAGGWDGNGVSDGWASNSGSTSGGSVVNIPTSQQVVLLAHCDGTNGSTTFVDSSVNPKTLTASGGAIISTEQAKFGTASAKFSWYGPVVMSSYSDDLVFGSGDFTVELWVYPTNIAYATGIISIAPSFPTSDSTYGIYIAQGAGYQAGLGGYVVGVGGVDFWMGSLVPNNQWGHVALVRKGLYSTLYYNGVAQKSAATPAVLAGGYCSMGRAFTVSHQGYLDEIRIVKGLAVYNGNFTPPSAPF